MPAHGQSQPPARSDYPLAIVGVDDGGARKVSLAIYNEDIAPTSYRIQVFDSTGMFAASGTTPSIPPVQALPGGAYGEDGTYRR